MVEIQVASNDFRILFNDIDKNIFWKLHEKNPNKNY